MVASVTTRICDHIGTNSERVRKPCPIGPPKGDSAAARSGSTWIHWWSSVASANVFTRSWVTSNHWLVPSTCPFSDGSSARVVVVVLLMRLSPRSTSRSAHAISRRRHPAATRDRATHGQTVSAGEIPAHPLVTPSPDNSKKRRVGGWLPADRVQRLTRGRARRFTGVLLHFREYVSGAGGSPGWVSRPHVPR